MLPVTNRRPEPSSSWTTIINLWKDIEGLTLNTGFGALDPLAPIFISAFLFEVTVSWYITVPLMASFIGIRTLVYALGNYNEKLSAEQAAKITELKEKMAEFQSHILKYCNEQNIDDATKSAFINALTQANSLARNDEHIPGTDLSSIWGPGALAHRAMHGFFKGLAVIGIPTFPVLTLQSLYFHVTTLPLPYRDTILYGLVAVDSLLILYTTATSILRDTHLTSRDNQIALGKELKYRLRQLQEIRGLLLRVEGSVQDGNPIIIRIIEAIEQLEKEIDPMLGKTYTLNDTFNPEDDGTTLGYQRTRGTSVSSTTLVELNHSIRDMYYSFDHANNGLRRRGLFGQVSKGIMPKSSGDAGVAPKPKMA